MMWRIFKSSPNFEGIYSQLRSVGNITIVITIVVATLATIDKGPYITINAIVTGGMWALMAVGLSLMLGVMGISNFAHGEIFMVGTLVAYYVIIPLKSYLGQHPNALLAVVAPIIAILAAAIMGAFSGVVSEKLLFYQLRKRSKKDWLLNCFLLSLGISVILSNGHQMIFGADYKGILYYWNIPPVSIFDVYISIDRIVIFALAIFTISLFWVFMKFTTLGQAIRAVSQDQEGAQAVGISVNAINIFTIGLSFLLAAIAGASLLFMYPSYPTVGVMPLYNTWFVITVVGFGNVGAAIPGGLVIAFLQVLTESVCGRGMGKRYTHVPALCHFNL